MTWEDDVARLVAETRQQHKLLQREMAELLSCDRSYIAKLENGSTQYPPSDEFWRRFAIQFGQNYDSLLALCGRISQDRMQEILEIQAEFRRRT